jgi:hypothetical protein
MKRESDEVNIIDVYMYENACIIAWIYWIWKYANVIMKPVTDCFLKGEKWLRKSNGWVILIKVIIYIYGNGTMTPSFYNWLNL